MTVRSRVSWLLAWTFVLLAGTARADLGRVIPTPMAPDEARTDDHLTHLYTPHFVVFYAAGISPRAAHRVADRLELVYRAVGERFASYPRAPFMVVLYPAERFHAATVSPTWARGLFDGAIRLRVEGSTPVEDSVLIHEYVHAVVHRLSRGRVPAWLSEGLALSFDGGTMPSPSLRGDTPALTALHVDFTALPVPAARAAYQASYDATQRLLGRYGMSRVRTLLQRLSTAPSFAIAFESVLGERYLDFERDGLARQKP